MFQCGPHLFCVCVCVWEGGEGDEGEEDKERRERREKDGGES